MQKIEQHFYKGWKMRFYEEKTHFLGQNFIVLCEEIAEIFIF